MRSEEAEREVVQEEDDLQEEAEEDENGEEEKIPTYIPTPLIPMYIPTPIGKTVIVFLTNLNTTKGIATNCSKIINLMTFMYVTQNL